MRLDINEETVHDIIESMDTAWDKKVMKVILGVYTFCDILKNTSHTFLSLVRNNQLILLLLLATTAATKSRQEMEELGINS